MPNPSLPILLEEIDRVLAPHLVRPNSLVTDIRAFGFVEELWHGADVLRLGGPALYACHQLEALGCLAVLRDFD